MNETNQRVSYDQLMEQAKRQRAQFLYHSFCQVIAFAYEKLDGLAQLLHEATRTKPLDTSATTGWENRMVIMQKLRDYNNGTGYGHQMLEMREELRKDS